jgi:hypothetical protein
MGKLYELHPIFEFFLTFYVGYLISEDLRDTVIQVLSRHSTKSKERAYGLFDSLVERINHYKERIRELTTKKAEISKLPDYNEEEFDKNINSLSKGLNDINRDLFKDFGYVRKDNGKIEEDFLKTLEPLSPLTLYCVLYSFALLLLNGIEYSHDEYANILFSFNVSSLIFFIIIFGCSFFKRAYIFFKSRFFTIIIFSTVLYLNIKNKIAIRQECNSYLFGSNDSCHIETCAIFFSIGILVIPILFNLLKFWIHRENISGKSNNLFEKYNKQIDSFDFNFDKTAKILLFSINEKKRKEDAKGYADEEISKLQSLKNKLDDEGVRKEDKIKIINEINKIRETNSEIIDAKSELSQFKKTFSEEKIKKTERIIKISYALLFSSAILTMIIILLLKQLKNLH